MGAALLSATPVAAAGTAPPEEGAPPPAASGAAVVPQAGWGPVPAGSPPRAWLPTSPPDEALKPKRNWYGWQILLPGVLTDLTGLIGAFTFPPILIGAAVGHGIYGPIIHLAHGRPDKAGLSFLLEAVLPAAAVGTTYLSASMCRGDCVGTVIIAAISVPATLIGGMVVDSAVLANEDVKPGSDAAWGRGGASFSLAPLLVPPLGSELGMAGAFRKGLGREAPVGLSLVGRF
jgi:hypothetical protein